MPSFAGSLLSADDAVALHARHYNALESTFSSDRHGTLPRPLRSYQSNNNRSITVLSATSLNADAQPALTSSVYRTPQWNEFSDCVREVSSDAEDRTSNKEVEGDGEDASDGDEPEVSQDASAAAVEDEEKEAVARHPRVSAEHNVVRRLADLSQSPTADPDAVAAALREAEALLRQRGDRAASSGGADGGQNFPRHSGRPQLRLADSDLLHRRDSRPDTSLPHEARDLWEGKERDSRPHLRRDTSVSQLPRDRHEKHRTLSSVEDVDAASPPTWPWPTAVSGNAVGATGASAAASPHQPLPFPHFTGSRDAVAHWYEVYYAWMLYYQQLYAAQILQHEQQQQRVRRRDARRAKRQQRHDHQLNDVLQAGTARADRPTAFEDFPPAKSDRRVRHLKERPSTVVEVGVEQPLPHHRSRSSRSNPTRAAAPADRNEDSHGGRRHAETQLLRAELHALEDKLAALSAVVAAGEDGEGSGAPHQTQHIDAHQNRPSTRRGSTHGGARTQSSAALHSPEHHAPRAEAVQQPVSMEAVSVGTWQALTERQRSRSAVRGDHRRRVTAHAQKRPQWK